MDRTLVLAFATHRGLAPDWRARCLVWSTWCLSGSWIAHVAVGTDGVMLEPRAEGDRFYALAPYLEHYPTLVRWYEVPIEPIDLEAVAILRPKRVWRSFLRRLTGGRVQSDDCSQIAIRALEAGGVDVPRRLNTPAQLDRWLRAQGFTCITKPPRPS